MCICRRFFKYSVTCRISVNFNEVSWCTFFMCWAQDRSAQMLAHNNLKLLTLFTTEPPMKVGTWSPDFPFLKITIHSLVLLTHHVMSWRNMTCKAGRAPIINFNLCICKESKNKLYRRKAKHPDLSSLMSRWWRVNNIRWMRMCFTKDLSISQHFDVIRKKPHWCLYFLRRLRIIYMSANTILTFYRCTVESILTESCHGLVLQHECPGKKEFTKKW